MGSFAKKIKYNDVDLNFFVKENNQKLIHTIRTMVDFFLDSYKLYLDINIIDNDMIQNNFFNSKIFIHRNRHSMILYEIKMLNNLIYGTPIINDVNYCIEDIMIETTKLILTIRHTLVKLYLKDNLDKNFEYIVKKNAKYAIEFYLLFKGVKNPYIINIDEYINKYLILNNKDIVLNIYNSNIKLCWEKLYDFIIEMGKVQKKELMNIVKNNISSSYYNIDILRYKYYEQFK